MSKSIAVMILSSPYGVSSSQTALDFCRTVIEQGHKITRLFFYNEGAYNGTNASVSSQDEINLPEAWNQFILDNELDAVVCIASGLKRGIIDDKEANRYDKPAPALHQGFELSGLGQWVDAVNNSDQHIVFGG